MIFFIVWIYLGISAIGAQPAEAQAFGKEKQAQEFYQAGLYEDALFEYQSILAAEEKKLSASVKARIYENIFRSYKALHNYVAALEWCKKYLEQNSQDTLTKIEYADLLKINGAYVLSLETYASLINELPRDPQIKKRYASTRWAYLNQDSLVEVDIQKTDFVMRDNLGFTAHKDDFFASAPTEIEGRKTQFYKIAQYKLLDSLKINAKPAFNLDIPDSLANSGSPTFDAQRTEMFYSAINSKKKYWQNQEKKSNNRLKIIHAIQKEGKWTAHNVVDFCDPAYNYTHPFLTSDGKKLFFISDKDNKFGNYDIFLAKRAKDGAWNAPRKLSSNVNSDRTEMFPFVYKEYLYFSSYGRDGFGGADLFRSKMDGEQFGVAENLGYPINSPQDDFQIVFRDSVNNSGYFTSNRADAEGRDALYYIRVTDDFSKKTIALTDSLRELQASRVLFLSSLDTKSLENTNSAQIEIFEKKEQDSVRILPEKNALGQSFVKLDQEKKYSLLLKSDEKTEQYIGNLAQVRENELIFFVDDPSQPNKTLSEEAVKALTPYSPLMQERLYFEFDRFNVLELEKIKLARSIELLQENPDLMILLEGHADSRGQDWYNDNLSRKRVVKVIEYLHARGIQKNQILFAFFGKRRLVSVNESKNRRVETQVVYKPATTTEIEK